MTNQVFGALATGFDEDTLTISSGKEFSLIKTVGGKVSAAFIWQNAAKCMPRLGM